MVRLRLAGVEYPDRGGDTGTNTVSDESSKITPTISAHSATSESTASTSVKTPSWINVTGAVAKERAGMVLPPPKADFGENITVGSRREGTQKIRLGKESPTVTFSGSEPAHKNMANMPTSTSEPKISAVIFSCNDNYSDDMVERTIMCFTYLLEAVDEIIYVDWGSPGGKSLLSERGIPKSDKIKEIIYTEEQVAEIVPPGGEKMGQVFPRNIGIRHATGDFITSTNIDILVPTRKEILGFLKDDRTMYVISRKDVLMGAASILFRADPQIVNAILMWHCAERNKPEDFQPEEYFAENIKKQLDSSSEPYRNYVKYAKIYNCGDFQVAHRKVWEGIRGFEEQMILHWGSDTNLQVKVVNAGYKLKVLTEPSAFHMSHPPRSSHRAVMGKEQKMNDMDKFMSKFKKTLNGDGWGYY